MPACEVVWGPKTADIVAAIESMTGQPCACKPGGSGGPCAFMPDLRKLTPRVGRADAPERVTVPLVTSCRGLRFVPAGWA
jgi:hypothetical protein